MVVAPGAVLDEIRLLVGEVNAPLRVGVDDKVHANVGFGLRVDERDSLLPSCVDGSAQGSSFSAL